MSARPWPSVVVVQEALDKAVARQAALVEPVARGRRRKRAVTAEEARNPMAIKSNLLRSRAYKVRWDWWWILAESGRYSINGIAQRVGVHHATVLNALNRLAGGKRSWRSGPAPRRDAPTPPSYYEVALISPDKRVIAVRRIGHEPTASEPTASWDIMVVAGPTPMEATR